SEIGVGLVGLLLLGLAGKLFQAVSGDPLAGIAGLVLTMVGGVAIWWWLSQRRRLTARKLADLLAMTPTQFEQSTANLLHDLGYTDVKRTGGAGDLNVDVWARDPQGKRVAVQC